MLYPKLYQKLRSQARGCRDRDVRIKLELILLAWKLENVAEACSRRGFSRKFYYKWLGRLKKSGWRLSALSEKSRRPWRSPRRISRELELRIHWFRRRQYGARMIQAMLAQEGVKITRATICWVLRRRRKRSPILKSRLNPHRKRYELLIPGQRLQMDVKYVPELVAGKRAYNYVIIDECTRYRYAKAYDQLSEGTTVAFLEEFLQICPFPIHTIQTDNGQEFTYALNPVAKHLKHAMDEWCERNGIHHRRIPPGVKELNGKVERSHRIDEQYFYWKAPTDNLEHFNAKLELWLRHYNEVRLHGGLGYQTPRSKLYERLKTLQTPLASPVQEQWEEFRLRFIQETPMKLSEQNRQRLRAKRQKRTKNLLILLEREFLKLKLAA